MPAQELLSTLSANSSVWTARFRMKSHKPPVCWTGLTIIRVSALRGVLIHGNNVEWGRVGGSVATGIIVKPVQQTVGLCDFMRSLHVPTLELVYKRETN